ncbi:MAG: hypothetical protein AAB804_02840 [Patescibacteria group bacterium]
MYKAVAMIRYACESVLDAILPLRERTARTKSREPGDIPLTLEVHDLLQANITTLMDYRNSAVQDLIRSLKYDGSGYAAQLGATLLADYLREEIASHRRFSKHKILIVPVPLHGTRARERGFNQVALVLESLPQEFRDGTLAKFAPEALTRARDTRPQTHLPRSERLSNVAGAFVAPNAALVGKTHVFLIDDVTTTGATLVNAATPLRRAGAEVTLLALARA